MTLWLLWVVQIMLLAMKTRPVQENVPLPGKGHAALKTAQPQQRSALGEIGNKVAARQPISGKLPFQEVKKKPVTKAISTRVNNVTNVLDKRVTIAPETLKKPVIKKCIVPTAQRPQNTAYSSKRLNFLDVPDIDKEDGNDPLLLGMYASDIYSYLREMEAKFPVRPNYLAGQMLTGRMRAVLVDWLVDVHHQFQMLQETLYLTVNNLDRFLQKVTNIHRKKFQLLGVSAMLLASKYEETYSPDVADFVYISDNAFTKADIFAMEWTIVKALSFSFGRPVAPHFLRRYSKAGNVQPKHHTMAKYFMELCLVEYEMCHIPPSQIAAAALFVVLWLCSGNEDKSVWSNTLVHYSQYTYRDIAPVVKKMAGVVVNAELSKYQAVRKKYSQSKLLKISCATELKSPSLKKLMES